MQNRIPATVITGFLGAGKTTLIRHLLAHAGDKKIALIVNEFGDVGVDGNTFKDCNAKACSADDIIELANGCICCTVADDFMPAMQKIIEQKPHQIIIETSGLALPQPLVQAFKWPDIRAKVMLDGVITVTDGKALAMGAVTGDEKALDAQRAEDPELDHETPIEHLFHDQIDAANIIIIAKSDTITGEELAAVTKKLQDMTHGKTPIIPSDNKAGRIPAIFGLGLEGEAFARSEGHHHHDHDDDDHDDEHGHDEFTSSVIDIPEIENHQQFIKRLEQVCSKHHILRAKGFIAIKGKAMPLIVQAVGNRIDHHFASNKTASQTVGQTAGRLVVIGLQSINIAEIAADIMAEKDNS